MSPTSGQGSQPTQPQQPRKPPVTRFILTLLLCAMLIVVVIAFNYVMGPRERVVRRSFALQDRLRQSVVSHGRGGNSTENFSSLPSESLPGFLLEMNFFNDRPNREKFGKVPFYMYKASELQTRLPACAVDSLKMALEYPNQANYTASLLFLHQLESHPWRVNKVEDAVLHVLPFHFDQAVAGLCGDFDSYLKVCEKNVYQLPAYKKSLGSDFVIVSGHPRISAKIRNQSNENLKFFKNFILATADVKAVDRFMPFCPIKIPYVPSPHPKEFPPDGVLTMDPKEYRRRPVMIHMGAEAVDVRHGIVLRRFIMEVLKAAEGDNQLYLWRHITGPEQTNWWEDFELPECGDELINCSIRFNYSDPREVVRQTAARLGRISQAQFNLITDVDQGRSQKMEDAALSGTLNVLIADHGVEQHLPFHNYIPWRFIVYRLPETDFEMQPLEMIKAIQTESDELLAARLQLYHQHLKDILWTHPESRVAENILLTAVAHCLTEADLLKHSLSKQDFECLPGSMHSYAA